jgi:hypothetical protein
MGMSKIYIEEFSVLNIKINICVIEGRIKKGVSILYSGELSDLYIKLIYVFRMVKLRTE